MKVDKTSLALLAPNEGSVAETVNAQGCAPLLLVCEHASSYIPESLAQLGLEQDARYSHIAWDIGARELAIALGRKLDASLVCSRVSRLVYDCNRPLEDASATPAISEVYDVPGNCALTDEQRQQRYNEVYLPFHQCVAEQLEAVSAGLNKSTSPLGQLPALVTVHSFTPVYRGQQRDVEIGLLHDRDARMATAMLAAAEQVDSSGGSESNTAYRVELNQPYSAADGVLHTLAVHATSADLVHVMIEVNNDLIRDAAGVESVALQLALMIESAMQAGTDGGNSQAQSG